MPSSATRRGSQATSAEVSFSHSLKNCLVNLPSSLCSILANVNALAQDVIVELSYRPPLSANANQTSATPTTQSIFVGWTGMQSKRKLAPIVNRDGISGTRGKQSERSQEVSLVEIDAAFARTLGLSDGYKVTASIHMDPPMAHTINIEPLTPEDWEMIELHAAFLEINLINQIRALPNPRYTPPGSAGASPHPLTLHLSPTSTANITIVSIVPEPSPDVPFAKLSPEAEVIVAPKSSSKSLKSWSESRSVASRRSASGRSGTSTARKKSARDEVKPSIFLRGVDRGLCEEYFNDGPDDADQGLRVWVDRDLVSSKSLKGTTWVLVTVLKPASLQVPIDPQKQQREIESMGEAGKITLKVVAKLIPWDDPPDSQHIALSSALCASMACEGIVGGIVKLEPAPPQVPEAFSQQTSDTSQRPSGSSTKVLKIFPFSSGTTRGHEGLKFGGESKAEREDASRRIMKVYGKHGDSEGILDGPLTSRSILGTRSSFNTASGWEGGIIQFDHPSSESGKPVCNWFLGSERKFSVEIQAAIPRPLSASEQNTTGDPLPKEMPVLVGIDALIDQLQSHLSHLSSVLLTGAQGSGKSVLTQLLAHRLRQEKFFHTTYFSCQKLLTDEIRVSTIKETFNRIFMGASWGARLGGRALVILDDLDKLCPAETELEVGSENGRSKQISECLCVIVRQYCTRDSKVVLLATAQAKESLHKVIVGGHLVKEIVSLKAPDKEGRRRVIEMLVKQNVAERDPDSRPTSATDRPRTADGSGGEEEDGAWMDGSSVASRLGTLKDGFVLSKDLDFLDLAGETDGYMPADLGLLVARARSEALIRDVTNTTKDNESHSVELSRKDFDAALQGFTPASLRNVTLQRSSTTFASIGGLHATRKILLETLQYPTTYAPIFAKCPLRLRSGLLLYGYPGCGKTLLASAVAGECGLNFISVKGPEILNKYIGASEKSVRDLFDRAEAARPCVLFFDEFDSIAPKRGHDSTGVTDRVVNQLLTQMDGAEGLSGVYVLAATSRPDLIDPALLRPGRLDKSLICDLPNAEDRTDILRALGTKLKLSPDVLDSLHMIAEQTVGYSGADLQALVTNAQLEAIHDVLGDNDHTQPAPGSRKTNGTSKFKGASGNKPFIQFRYGLEKQLQEDAARARAGHNKSQMIAEKAAINAKLAEIKAAKKKAKMPRELDEEKDKGEKEDEKDTEVVIEWRHVVKSLKTTRASISAEERRRLGLIYREFVVGRNGEMRDGEGGREVGGRTSLM